MLIAVTASGEGGLKAGVDPRFGRAKRFLIIETEGRRIEADVENSGAAAQHGAGTHAAGLVAKYKVKAVLAGNYGPKAHASLEGLGIKMWLVPEGLSVGQALDRFSKGELEALEIRRF
ncbi:NifB/NifX family molybdenum-iron cluster-binding protein [bacterium]|nr:NifB/NifX family molybdenum-iron cluster-binding protein [bacterium]